MSITDLFGVEVPPPDHEWPKVSEAWVEGWTCGMSCVYETMPTNPYDPGEDEYQDWQDGYEAARSD